MIQLLQPQRLIEAGIILMVISFCITPTAVFGGCFLNESCASSCVDLGSGVCGQCVQNNNNGRAVAVEGDGGGRSNGAYCGTKSIGVAVEGGFCSCNTNSSEHCGGLIFVLDACGNPN